MLIAEFTRECVRIDDFLIVNCYELSMLLQTAFSSRLPCQVEPLRWPPLFNPLLSLIIAGEKKNINFESNSPRELITDYLTRNYYQRSRNGNGARTTPETRDACPRG